MDSVKVVQKILDEHGITILDPNDNLELDSLQLISVICSIENELNAQIDDVDLLMDDLTFNGFVRLVEKYIK